MVVSHVDERGFIDDVSGRPAQEVAQKRQPRLAWTGAKHREAIGADVSGEARLALMARAGVVDCDERRAAEARGQDLLVLGAERLEFGHQQPHHLALRDHHAGPVQQRQNPLTGHLPLKMQHQHEAMQVRTITAHNARIERRDQGLAVGRLPAFAPITRHRGIENEVLNDDLLIALAARPPGAATGTTTVRSIFSFSRLLPRRRVERSPFVPPAAASDSSVAFSIPEGFCGGRGGSFL